MLVYLVASEILQFEIERIPDTIRRAHAYEALSKARVYIDVNEPIAERARELTRSGIQPLDALHLAAAIQAKADFFCTCDDKLLRRARSLGLAEIKVVSPIDLIVELGL
jgi:predicted nucleic acid-binding protein